MVNQMFVTALEVISIVLVTALYFETCHQYWHNYVLLVFISNAHVMCERVFYSDRTHPGFDKMRQLIS